MSESTLVRYYEDDVIVKQGERSPYLYKVISGNVALYFNYGKQEEYLVGILSFPHCFGEMSILAGLPSAYTVVAINQAVLLKVTEESFESFIKDNHQNAIMIMKTMARNINMANMNMTMLMDELKEISKAKVIDGEALKRLTSQYSDDGSVLEELETEKIIMKIQEEEIEFPILKKYSAVKHPEYKNYIYSKKYTCMACGETFESHRIFTSKLKVDREKFKKVRYDMRQAYVDFEPYWYELITCPHCYFSTFASFFLEGRGTMEGRYEQQLKDAVKNVHMNFKEDKDINFVLCQHYLALICAQGLYKQKEILAKLWKNLTWIYEDMADDEMRVYAAQKAIEALNSIYENCDIKSDKGQSLTLTIAAMYQVCGENEEAKKWAYIVRRSGRKGMYRDMAEDFMEELK